MEVCHVHGRLVLGDGDEPDWPGVPGEVPLTSVGWC